VKSYPDIEAAKAEGIKILQETLGRFGEFLEHQWTGRRTGTPSDPGYDLKLRFKVASGNGKGQVWWIHAVIRTVVHPRQARQAIWDLQRSPAITPEGEGVYPLLIAPHLSASVAAMCEEAHVGHLDLSGNCNIEFGGIWIDRQRIERKYKEEQRQKSIYTPKASRILRVLLQGPLRPHKVEDLANAADVSLGLVSKIRKVLLDEEVAIDTKDGIQIKHPQAILRDWILEDDFSQRTQVREYSTLASGETIASYFDRFCAGHNSVSDTHPLFTLTFAAWLRAPHNVPTTVSAYLDLFPDEHELVPFLQARPVSQGAGNLRIIVPSDFKALTIDKQKAKKFPELSLVSDLQLFLDLHGGEPNGPEQARVLRDLEDFNGGWT